MLRDAQLAFRVGQARARIHSHPVPVAGDVGPGRADLGSGRQQGAAEGAAGAVQSALLVAGRGNRDVEAIARLDQGVEGGDRIPRRCLGGAQLPLECCDRVAQFVGRVWIRRVVPNRPGRREVLLRLGAQGGEPRVGCRELVPPTGHRLDERCGPRHRLARQVEVRSDGRHRSIRDLGGGLLKSGVCRGELRVGVVQRSAHRAEQVGCVVGAQLVEHRLGIRSARPQPGALLAQGRRGRRGVRLVAAQLGEPALLLVEPGGDPAGDRGDVP